MTAGLAFAGVQKGCKGWGAHEIIVGNHIRDTQTWKHVRAELRQRSTLQGDLSGAWWEVREGQGLWSTATPKPWHTKLLFSSACTLMQVRRVPRALSASNALAFQRPTHLVAAGGATISTGFRACQGATMQSRGPVRATAARLQKVDRFIKAGSCLTLRYLDEVDKDLAVGRRSRVHSGKAVHHAPWAPLYLAR